MAGTLGSVVIPAHNEALVIEQCLDVLFDDVGPDDLEVVVVCNGCSDDTSQAIRASGHPVEVVEIAEASKPAALRAADQVARSFPRIYLDADVLLPGSSARLVLQRLREGQVLAARPPIRYDTSRSSLLVRSYYRARARIPAVMGSLWGAGTYGLSEGGRARFGPYPDTTAEDLYVDHHFSHDEIEIVSCSPVVVRAPRRTRDLLRILQRTYRGNAEYRASAGPCSTPASPGRTLRDTLRLPLAGPLSAIDALAYATVAISARVVSRLAPSRGWERDDSSRAG